MNRRFGFLIAVLIIIGFLISGLNGPVKAEGDNPPGVFYSSLLKNFQVLPRTGRLRMYNIQGVFLPGADTKGWAIISREGEELYHFDFKVQKMKNPFYIMDFYQGKNLKTGDKVEQHQVALKEPGNYKIDFYLPTGKFYSFPFSISVLRPANSFKGKEAYLLEGAWNRWGYLYYAEANPEKILIWKKWLNTKSLKSYQDVKVLVELKDSAGKVLAQNRKNMTYTLRHDWNRFDFDLVHPKGGSIYPAKELLAKDGSYSINMTVDGKSYGKWNFKIVNGQLNYTGRTLRGKADPLTFIEGGQDAWWYEKE